MATILPVDINSAKFNWRYTPFIYVLSCLLV